jgi:hypothetical protein
MMIRLAVRGFAGEVMKFEEVLDFDEDKLDALLPDLAEKHARAMAADQLHMIEIEFLDEPDLNQRFFRFGTDPAAMRDPVAVAHTSDFDDTVRNRWGKDQPA